MRLLSPEKIRRFELGDPLGEGADMQAFSAVDAESGEPVVVKRPHPSFVSRNAHRDIEARTLLQAELRIRMGDVNGLVRLRMLTERDRFAWYFGDDPGRPYLVQVEERARGIPLLGGVSDMVRGHPVALPLNLFVLHPARACIPPGHENPVFTVLDVIRRVHETGCLAQDLGPQNVFYSPLSGRSRVIDLGAVSEPAEATRRRPALDLNDVLFDIFRLYTTPEKPPGDAARFTQAREFRVSGALERRAESFSAEFTAVEAGRAEAALKILSTIGERGYGSTARFEADFRDYISAAEPPDSAAEDAWREAAQALKSPYWSKYLFEADSELAGTL